MEPTLLDPEAFPVEIMLLRSDTQEPVWGVTLLRPPPDTLTPVYIPPAASWVGVPVAVRTTFNGGEPHIEHPPPGGLRPQG